MSAIETTVTDLMRVWSSSGRQWSPDDLPPVTVMRYANGGKYTLNVYSDAETAKECVKEVDGWILRGRDWHSLDGRTVIYPDDRAGRAARGVL